MEIALSWDGNRIQCIFMSIASCYFLFLAIPGRVVHALACLLSPFCHQSGGTDLVKCSISRAAFLRRATHNTHWCLQLFACKGKATTHKMQ